MNKVFIIIFVLTIFLALVFFFLLKFLPAKPTTAPPAFISPSPSSAISPIDSKKQFCAQVITPAKNQKTGECKEFPTPCDVPEGWEKVASCN